MHAWSCMDYLQHNLTVQDRHPLSNKNILGNKGSMDYTHEIFSKKKKTILMSTKLHFQKRNNSTRIVREIAEWRAPSAQYGHLVASEEPAPPAPGIPDCDRRLWRSSHDPPIPTAINWRPHAFIHNPLNLACFFVRSKYLTTPQANLSYSLV